MVPIAAPVVVLKTAFCELLPVPPCVPDVCRVVVDDAVKATFAGAIILLWSDFMLIVDFA